MNLAKRSLFSLLSAVAVLLWLVPYPAYSEMNSALHEAAANGDLAAMQKMLADGADINGRDKDGTTPLMAAAARRQNEALKLLLERGADVNAKIETEPELKGYTALMAAIMRENGEGAKILIAKGADINAKLMGRWSPLVFASAAGQTEIVDLLLKKGANKTNLKRDIDALNKVIAERQKETFLSSLEADLRNVRTAAYAYFADHSEQGSIITTQAQLEEDTGGTLPLSDGIVFVRADLSETSGGIVLRNNKLNKDNSIAAKGLQVGEGMINFAGQLLLPILK